MDREPNKTEHSLIRQNRNLLSVPTAQSLALRTSDCSVVLSFAIDGLSNSDFDKLLKAEALLNEIGIHFDRGIGFGQRDWMLDGTMMGAWVRIQMEDEEVIENVGFEDG